MVEEIHLMLYEDDDYQRFLYAVYDEQAIEGSLAADNIMAAGMIRDKAGKVDKFHPLLTGNDGSRRSWQPSLNPLALCFVVTINRVVIGAIRLAAKLSSDQQRRVS